MPIMKKANAPRPDSFMSKTTGVKIAIKYNNNLLYEILSFCVNTMNTNNGTILLNRPNVFEI